MAIPIIVGPLAGAFAGAALYYTVSHSISTETSKLSRELRACTNALARTAKDEQAAPFGESSSIATPSSAQSNPPALSELVRQKWNTTLGLAVNKATTTSLEDVAEGLQSSAAGIRAGVENLWSRVQREAPRADERRLDSVQGTSLQRDTTRPT